MVKSLENGILLPPFLVKCYEMVSDETTDELICWTESNDSFIIWDETRFASELLPKYFKHSKFSSFIRQLNIYGFRKIDTDRWQFANEDFIKGQKHLLQNISRRKQTQNPNPKKISHPNSKATPQEEDVDHSQPSEEDKRLSLWDEVENIKTDKDALVQNLNNLSQLQQNSQNKLLLLRDRLNGMEKNQQQVLSFIVMVMQSPELMVQFFQPKENSWHVAENGSSKLSEVTDICEPNPSDGAMIEYQPREDGSSIAADTLEPATNSDDLMDLEFSSDDIRDLLMKSGFLLSPRGEKLLPFENHENLHPGKFVLPYLPENDLMLEQLLLPNPSMEDEQVTGFETDSYADPEMRMGLTYEPNESETFTSLDDDDNENQKQASPIYTDREVEDLSKKIEDLYSLASEIMP